VDVAALILWILTAGGGFYLLATWIANGGARRTDTGTGSNFPTPLIFGHMLLAAAGLIVWIAYLASDSDAAGWIAFTLLAVVALLGFTMFAKWIPTYRAAQAAPGRVTARAAPSAPPASTSTSVTGPAERHFPLPIVIGHGLLAATTLVLVLLTMLGVGGS